MTFKVLGSSLAPNELDFEKKTVNGAEMGSPNKGRKVCVPSKHFMLSTVLKMVAESENIDMYFKSLRKLWIVPHWTFSVGFVFLKHL